jgi:hypothetical protein
VRPLINEVEIGQPSSLVCILTWLCLSQEAGATGERVDYASLGQLPRSVTRERPVLSAAEVARQRSELRAEVQPMLDRHIQRLSPSSLWHISDFDGAEDVLRPFGGVAGYSSALSSSSTSGFSLGTLREFAVGLALPKLPQLAGLNWTSQLGGTCDLAVRPGSLRRRAEIKSTSICLSTSGVTFCMHHALSQTKTITEEVLRLPSLKCFCNTEHVSCPPYSLILFQLVRSTLSTAGRQCGPRLGST